MRIDRTTVRLLTGLVAIFTGLLLIALLHRDVRAQNEPQNAAELWLSWSPEARLTYVWGYLDGFGRGKHAGCYFYGEKMDQYLPHEGLPPEKLPEFVCTKSLPEFTESTHFQVYVDAITSYYKKYPRDRQAGMSRLLEEMASPPGLSVDEIHKKLTQ